MKYKINKSNNADSRTATSKKKEDLKIDTLTHIKDVQSVLNLVSRQLQLQAINHDKTKLSYFDEFYKDWSNDDGNFMKKEWYNKHITEERHHSNSYLHDDFNLLDLIEEIVDKVCAGKGRTGLIDMSYFKYDDELLQKALLNTINYVDSITK